MRPLTCAHNGRMPNNHEDAEYRSIIVIDAANVVGSKPDGWWRDRKGATERLRDNLAHLSERELVDGDRPHVILVVEGQARGIESSPTVEVVNAPGSGDDQIVELVAAQIDHPCTVVTADRELKNRVTALGAQVLGPRSVLD